MRFSVLVGIAALFFGLLAWPLVTNRVPSQSDLGRYHLPVREFHQRCLQNGDCPDWCPQLFCGFDLHGEGQGGFDHPWHRLIYTFLPLTIAFNIEVFANFPFLFAGMYLFLRRHQLPRDAALAGAIAATFSGFNLPHYAHTNAIAIIAHIPWLLWAADKMYSASSFSVRCTYSCVIALLTGSQLLLGYPQYVLFSSIAEIVYAVLLTWTQRQFRPVVWWMTAKCLGVIIGAAQWLPTLQALQFSPRIAYDRDFRGMGSLPPFMLLQPLAPTIFNEFMQLHEYTVHAGALATLGGIWWIASGRGWGTNVLDRWAFWMVVIVIPLALGKHSPLYSIYLKLPIVGLFRFPCRYLILFHLAAAVVVARLVQRLSVCPVRPMPIRALAWILLLGGVALLLAENSPHIAEYARGDLGKFMTIGPVNFVGAGFLMAAAICFVVAGLGVRFAIVALVVIGFADLGYYSFRTMDLSPLQRVGIPITNIFQFMDLPNYKAGEPRPPNDSIGRIDVRDVDGNGLIMLGYRLTRGYVGLSPPRLLDYSQPFVQRLAGTTWYFDGSNWSPIEGLPRARLVTDVVVSQTPLQSRAAIDPVTTAVVDQPVDVVAGISGSATIAEDRPGHIVVETSSSGRQLLVLAESFHPNWQAVVDGEPTHILRAYSDFQGVVVPAGQHRIIFSYRPRWHDVGKAISLSGLTALLLLLVSSFIMDKLRGRALR